ncbi:acyl-CoA thioesterase [Streptomyces sp. NPDC091217]|uniref:acyl-CoA thioesterase n=1 Tax=Streptomyces sp. NPDC091217 TaxID=3365975 RepID=UPI0037FE7FE4
MSPLVQWSDTDASGRFHFTAPMKWVEDAEHRFYRDVHLDPACFPRRAVQTSYVRPLGAGDHYDIDFEVDSLGRTSITYQWRIRAAAGICVEGSHVVVHVGPDGKPAPVPDTLRAVLKAASRRTSEGES